MYCRDLTTDPCNRARRAVGRAALCCCSLLALAGCTGQNAFVPGSYHQSQLQAVHQQQLAAQQQTQQYWQRASGLDQNNQELQQMLAESRQQVQLLQSHLNATRGRLKEATEQIAQVEDDKLKMEDRVQVLEASMQRRGGATISANNNLRDRMPTVDIPGVELQLDGDVVRCRIPCQMLFAANSSQLLQGADVTIERIGDALGRAYPEQIIGIEGHTDNQPLSAGSPHHLTAAQALAVQERLVSSGVLPASQTFTAGHGGNQPLYSNATPAGQQRNRRIEIVVYPEVIGAAN